MMGREQGRRAVFLDRDGTIIRDRNCRFDPDNIELMPNAAVGLRRLQAGGYRLIVITNQAAVARGFATEEHVRRMHHGLHRLLNEQGVEVDAYYYCPHHPEGVVPRYAVECECRKPKPGMLLQAARSLGVAPESSWMVGDIWSDVAAGQSAGCRTVLVQDPDRPEEKCPVPPVFVARDILSAAEFILDQDNA